MSDSFVCFQGDIVINRPADPPMQLAVLGQGGRRKSKDARTFSLDQILQLATMFRIEGGPDVEEGHLPPPQHTFLGLNILQHLCRCWSRSRQKNADPTLKGFFKRECCFVYIQVNATKAGTFHNTKTISH